MIIDVHAHLGWDQVFDEDFTLQDLLNKHQRFSINKTIVQPGSCHTIEDVRKQHDVIAEASKRYPGQFHGMANPNPHLPELVYETEVRRCVEELGFVGIKIHTAAHGVNPGSRDGRKVFKLADKLGVPVMIHTGAGIPFANPSYLIQVAQDFPEVKIVMAHCGMMIMAGEVPIIMRACPNVYADMTWTAGFNIRNWSREFGAHRFMYGSDHADNAGTELGKIQTCDLTEEEREWIHHRSASAVYALDGGER
ncbi:amidohydrolase family protein [Paenibacillus sp. HB172176]|uniref:amidohydrolase family protein n=1 Tax=Paenibacillus sp. HB172176 TaxID=2493690 RepID=UPI00143AAE00|nr:amidohydrolase family protein [Paenibacillus sp. HB172176]